MDVRVNVTIGNRNKAVSATGNADWKLDVPLGSKAGNVDLMQSPKQKNTTERRQQITNGGVPVILAVRILIKQSKNTSANNEKLKF